MKSTPAKLTGILSLVAAVVLLIAGIVTWGMISSQLKDEKIEVANGAPFLVGKEVSGPFTAFAQAEAIKTHTRENDDPDLNGKTYSELSNLARSKDNPDLAKKANDALPNVMNGAFLRSSLFTSVLAYGVCAMVFGLAVMFALIGWALLSLTGSRVATVAHAA